MPYGKRPKEPRRLFPKKSGPLFPSHPGSDESVTAAEIEADFAESLKGTEFDGITLDDVSEFARRNPEWWLRDPLPGELPIRKLLDHLKERTESV